MLIHTLPTPPLHTALFEHDFQEFSNFVQRGVVRDARDEHGATALHLSCGYPFSISRVRVLLDAGFDVEAVDKDQQRPLHYACFTGSWKKAQLLLEKGATVNAVDQEERTPLHYVCMPFRLLQFRLYLQQYKTFDSFESLVQDGRHAFAKLLIDRGANLEAVDEVRNRPIHCACELGDPGLVAQLLDSGADIEAKVIEA